MEERPKQIQVKRFGGLVVVHKSYGSCVDLSGDWEGRKSWADLRAT